MDSTSKMSDMVLEDNDSLQMEAVSDAGYDKTADSRSAPEVKIDKIYARRGSIVIVGLENGEGTEKQITVNEAMSRCRALLEMAKSPWKYPSDLKETRRILKMFVSAIETAQEQLFSAVGSAPTKVYTPQGATPMLKD